MKKSRIISVALTLALVLTTVFAGTEGVFADTDMRTKSFSSTGMSALSVNEDDLALSTTMKALSDTSLVKALDLNSTASPQGYYVNYSKDSSMEVPVSIPKAGTFAFNFYGIPQDSTFALYDSEDPNADPVEYVNAYASSSTQTWYVNVKKAGTYYLAFYTNSTTTSKISFDVRYAPKTVSSPKLSKSYWAASTNGGYVYYKVKASSTGYITVSFPKGYNGNSSTYYVKLMNSSKSKNLLKNAVKVDSGKSFTTYGAVPKGTYYVGIKTTDKIYQFNLKFNKVTEKSGSTRAKAKSIYKGNTKKGTILATQTSKNADWYKIKINGYQAVNLSLITKTGGSSGGIRLSVFYANKSKSFCSFDYYGYKSGTISLYTENSGGMLAPGTYYIKVSKYGLGNGYYQLKWK